MLLRGAFGTLKVVAGFCIYKVAGSHYFQLQRQLFAHFVVLQTRFLSFADKRHINYTIQEI